MPILDNIKQFFTRKPKEAQRPNTAEVMKSELASFTSRFLNYKENPDEVLKYQSAGQNYDLYLTMVKKDPDLSGILESRARAVASKPWEVAPFDESDEALNIAEFCSDVVAHIPKLTEVMVKMLNAPWMGFGVSEIIWEVADNGIVVVTDLKDRHQNRFKFAADGTLKYKPSASATNYLDVPPQKFLVLQYNTIGENPYGTPLAQKAYWYWWFKNGALKSWVIAVDKYGAPTVKITYPAWLSEDEKDSLADAIDDLMYGTGITVSTGTEVELLEATRATQGQFDTLIKKVDESYARLILGQTLTSGEGQRVGSMALGNVHADVKQDILRADAELLMDAFNQLIRWLVDFNFPNAVGYPEFLIKYEPEKDRKSDAEVTRAWVDMGLEVPVSYAYEVSNIPRPEEGEPTLKVAAPVPLGGPGKEDDQNSGDTQAQAAQGGKITLTADVSTIVGLMAQFRNQNVNLVADMADKIFSRLNHKASNAEDLETDNTAVRLSSSPTVRLAAEDPEQFLPGLPPLPEPLPGAPMPKQPSADLKRYQIGALAAKQEEARITIRKIFNGLTRALLSEFGQSPEGAMDFLEEYILNTFRPNLREPISTANREAIRKAARDMAQQLGMNFNAPLFTDLTQSYLRVHAYETGTIDGIAQTARQIFGEEIRAAMASGGNIDEMVTQLRERFPMLADWKARQIAVTETRAAANWSVLEMGIRSRMDLEAWFITDPESCIRCQELAAGNPYPLRTAQSNLLPHPNCNDIWVLTKRGTNAS